MDYFLCMSQNHGEKSGAFSAAPTENEKNQIGFWLADGFCWFIHIHIKFQLSADSALICVVVQHTK